MAAYPSHRPCRPGCRLFGVKLIVWCPECHACPECCQCHDYGDEYTQECGGCHAQVAAYDLCNGCRYCTACCCCH